MADSKKINPIEKAGISGVASGATIEGLSALMGADSIEKKYFTRYGFSEGGKEWGEISFEWMPTVNEWRPYNEDDPLSKDDLELFRKEKEYELVNEMLNDEKSRLHTFYINNPYHVDEEEFNTKYEVLNEDGEIENLGLLISWDEPEIEYRKSQYSTDPETPLYRFEFLDAEEQSAYWFLKGEMQSRAPLNEMDLEQIMEMLQNVPKKEMDDAIEQAEMMGDEAAMIVLVMADNKRKFREEYASEDEELSHEQLRAYFARLKDKNPKLAKEIEISIKDQSYLPPHSVINKAGFDYEIIEAWADLVAEEDKYAPFERCDECEGEGYILTSYTSATRFDPADGDGEDCGECGGTGEIDPADYMYSNHDGQVGYLAETFNTEYDEEDMVHCNHCSDIVGNEKEVYGDETVDYEMANGELVCIPCHKIWMKEYKNDLDPHYSPFYAETFESENEVAKTILNNLIKNVWNELVMGENFQLERWLNASVWEGEGSYYKEGMQVPSRSNLGWEEIDEKMGYYSYWPDDEAYEMVEKYQDKLRMKYRNPSIKLQLSNKYRDSHGGMTYYSDMKYPMFMKISIGKDTVEKNAETFESENEKEVAIAVEKTRRGDTLYGIKYLDLGYEHTEWFMSKTDRDLHLDMYVEGFSAETESILKSPYLWGAGIFALTLGILSRKL